ncbi:MAG: DUF91 domain-containing protein [Thermoproteus sp.]|nr:DUF91 domain-containing protein [Thermoproteus sp.]
MAQLLEPGLTVVGLEVPLGVRNIDILARGAAGRYVVVEVKKGAADHEAAFQLKRYVDALSKAKGETVEGILAASRLRIPLSK